MGVLSKGVKSGVGGGVPGRSWFDAYSLQAQWAPVLVVIAPPIVAAYTSIPGLVGVRGFVVGGLLSSAAPLFLAQFARNLGKSLEPKLWTSWGGKPTVRFLRHRDETIAELTKSRYFQTLAIGAAISRPTREEETADPIVADAAYDSAGDWLRRQTRGPKSAGLVAAKNASYGFARNLLGVRWLGFAAAATTAITQVTYLSHLLLTDADPPAEVAASALLNVAAALLWLYAVRPVWVSSAADAYALALLECSEPKATQKTTASKSKQLPEAPQPPAASKPRKRNTSKAASQTPVIKHEIGD